MATILNESRSEFVIYTKPFITESLIAFFDYLKEWYEKSNSNKTKPNLKKSMLEFELIRSIRNQIHPDVLSKIQAHYKGKHPLL